MPSLTDPATMTAMRIATNGRTVARVTAELALSRVTGEYLAGFAFDLNPIERERVAREINRDLNGRHQLRSYVVCEGTDKHPDRPETDVQLIKMIRLNLEDLCDEVLSRERSPEYSLVILSHLLEDAWELYRREWDRAVERHDRDAYPDPRPTF